MRAANAWHNAAHEFLRTHDNIYVGAWLAPHTREKRKTDGQAREIRYNNTTTPFPNFPAAENLAAGSLESVKEQIKQFIDAICNSKCVSWRTSPWFILAYG